MRISSGDIRDIYGNKVFGDNPSLAKCKATSDFDGDGLKNYEEIKIAQDSEGYYKVWYKSDPKNPDTDGDGIDDNEDDTDPLLPIVKDSLLLNAIHDNKAVAKVIDNYVFFEFSDTFNFSNYGDTYSGKMVLTLIDNELRTFIVRADVNGVSIPFGEFDPNPIETLLSDGWGGKTFSHYNFRSENLPDSLKGKKDNMKSTTSYYATAENAYSVGTAILTYLGYIDSNNTKTVFMSDELDSIAGDWSGSSGKNKFCGEIEAHAELLLNPSIITNSVKTIYNLKGRSDEDYYKSLAIADLAKDDNGIDKTIMDLYWGMK